MTTFSDLYGTACYWASALHIAGTGTTTLAGRAPPWAALMLMSCQGCCERRRHHLPTHMLAWTCAWQQLGSELDSYAGVGVDLTGGRRRYREPHAEAAECEVERVDLPYCSASFPVRGEPD